MTLCNGGKKGENRNKPEVAVIIPRTTGISSAAFIARHRRPPYCLRTSDVSSLIYSFSRFTSRCLRSLLVLLFCFRHDLRVLPEVNRVAQSPLSAYNRDALVSSPALFNFRIFQTRNRSNCVRSAARPGIDCKTVPASLILSFPFSLGKEAY